MGNPGTPNMENNPLPLPPKSHSLTKSGLQPPKRHVRKNPLIVPSAMVSNLIRNENVSTCLYGSSASNTKSSPLRQYNPNDQDAFETALEENMDALDNIGGEGGEESLFLDESTPESKSGFGDEVRLMMKVLDRAQPDDCLKTLHLTNGNMHHAIKLVKLKKLIKVHGVTDQDMLSTLQIEDWDVAKAASYIMKRLQ